MAGITQTIPRYDGGISEQPAQLKLPGQVKNVENAYTSDSTAVNQCASVIENVIAPINEAK